MRKKRRSTLSWFTLIEIIIVLGIIALLAVGISNVNWNRLTEKQRSAIFINRVISQVETIRNNALLGKWVWEHNMVPDIWRIDIGEGGIFVYYSSWATWNNYSSANIIPNQFESISSFDCGQGTSSTGSIVIEQSQLSLSWSCDVSNHSSMYISLWYADFTEVISINTINGLVQ
jgi:prepilin-type N-terminal cleavage/methylation domain-containing protein